MKDNGFLNILLTVVIPVLILNKGTAVLGPGLALAAALSLPVAFAIWDGIQRRKLNGFAVLGFLNVAITGSFALLGLTGFWFAVKEASFPLLIAIFVLYSSYRTEPFLKKIFWNPQLLDITLIEKRIQDLGKASGLEQLLRQGTRWLAHSFFLSALLNFILARRIFTELPMDLDETARAVRLNEQIADMTSWSMLVILVPSMVFLSLILYRLLNGLKDLTGLTSQELMNKPDQRD